MTCSSAKFPIAFVFLLFAPGWAKSAPRTSQPNIVITDHYSHQWIKFPTLVGSSIFGDKKITVKPEEGRIKIIVFISSWDVSSQRLVPKLKKIEQKYKNLYTDIYYIFSHDLRTDARNFTNEFRLDKDKLILGNTEILKKFHNPPLVTIYMSDRRGWLSHRMLKAEAKDIKTLDTIISKMVRF